MSDLKFKIDLTQFNKLISEIEKDYKDLMPRIGNEIVNHSHEAFSKQAWDGVSWTNKHGSSNLLIGSGSLRRSIRLDHYDHTSCLVISDEVYSEIQNEGGRIEDTNGGMQSFCWAKYYETGEENWKWSALKLKRDGYIDIPKRQFLGESEELNKRIEKLLKSIFNKK
jgi:phage gpG-like protein